MSKPQKPQPPLTLVKGDPLPLQMDEPSPILTPPSTASNARFRQVQAKAIAYRDRLTANRAKVAERTRLAEESRQAYFQALFAGKLPRQISDPGVCTECGGTSFIHYDVPIWHEQFGKLHPCPACGEQQRLALAKKRWKSIALPNEYKDYTFANYAALPLLPRQKQVLADVQRWSESIIAGLRAQSLPDDNWLFLSGSVGVGKTGLAISALKHITDTLETGGAYLELSSFIRRCRQTFSEMREHEKDSQYHRGPDVIISDYAKAPILVIDDLGAGRFSAWSLQEVFYPIIVKRHEERLPTIFTSNFNLQEIYEWIAATENCFDAEMTGRRFADRLGQHCAGVNFLTMEQHECKNFRQKSVAKPNRKGA